MKVSAGDPAPLFTLTDQHGNDWSLADHRGRRVVLYFYPKDDTKGCTRQACDVRDSWEAFSREGIDVVGISPDDADSHAAFAQKYGLPHTLLADPERRAIDAYGVWGEVEFKGKTYRAVIRSSVVIDEEGRVSAVFDRIKPEEQSARTLQVLEQMGTSSAR